MVVCALWVREHIVIDPCLFLFRPFIHRFSEVLLTCWLSVRPCPLLLDVRQSLCRLHEAFTVPLCGSSLLHSTHMAATFWRPPSKRNPPPEGLTSSSLTSSSLAAAWLCSWTSKAKTNGWILNQPRASLLSDSHKITPGRRISHCWEVKSSQIQFCCQAE